MAQLSLGESKWRMIRRVLNKERFTFADTRNMTRHDQSHFDWLVNNGFFEPAHDDTYTLTLKARKAADLGMYELDPATRGTSSRRAIAETTGA